MTTRGYLGQVFEVRPVLAAMEDRGMPIDDAARIALGVEFERAQDDLGAEIVGLAGDCGLVDVFATLNPELRRWFVDHGTDHRCWHEHPPEGIRELKAERFVDKDGAAYRYDYRTVEVAATGGDGEPTTINALRWTRVWEFNPNSGDQVMAYMRAKGHPIPKDKHRENADGDAADTTNAKELSRLARKTGDTFYLKVIEYRGLTKMRGTYVDGFAPGPDGCVHTAFTFQTGIGQLSSRNPNIQNFPKLKPTRALANAMRRMVAARPGHVITEWDFKSCHIITLGFLAEDLNYMRLGRLDMHSFVAGHFLDLWDGRELFKLSDDELRAKFKWLKSNPEWKLVRDDQAKHGILGIGNGLQARGLYERYMESFPPRVCPACKGTGREVGARAAATRKCATCKGTAFQSGQDIADEVLRVAELLFPRIAPFQESQRREAHERTQLTTPFGHIRRFYEVYRWDSKRAAWGHGDQAEEAVAFRLANIAFGHIREKLKELAAEGLDERYGLFNNVHDSFMFHFPEELLARHIAEVWPVLVAPSKVLVNSVAPGGLSVGVEGSVGRNWSDKTDQNPEGMTAIMMPKETANAAATACTRD